MSDESTSYLNHAERMVLGPSTPQLRNVEVAKVFALIGIGKKLAEIQDQLWHDAEERRLWHEQDMEQQAALSQRLVDELSSLRGVVWRASGR